MSRKTQPSWDDIALYEREMADILRTASELVSDVRRERNLYENYIAKEFAKRGLTKEWKLPIWINKDTLIDY